MTKEQLTPESTKAIESYFSSSTARVFQLGELRSLCREMRRNWGFKYHWGTNRIIDELLQFTALSEASIQSETYKPFTRFVWPGFSIFELALSLRGKSYISHGSALSLHGLTDQIPKMIYVNKEQSEKPAPTSPLTQERLDRAFRGQQRTSNYVYAFEGTHLTLLSGKHSSQLGVEILHGEYGEEIKVTGIERTLIDIVVRPAYAGGISTVADAYRAAREFVSIEKLRNTLAKLDYIYPYHQAIGFLMQRAEYPAEDCESLRSLGLNFNFYLVNKMRQPAFDEEWRLFFPKGL